MKLQKNMVFVILREGSECGVRLFVNSVDNYKVYYESIHYNREETFRDKSIFIGWIVNNIICFSIKDTYNHLERLINEKEKSNI